VNALLGGKIGAEFSAGCERATVEGVFSIDTLPVAAKAGRGSCLCAAAAANGGTPTTTMFVGPLSMLIETPEVKFGARRAKWQLMLIVRTPRIVFASYRTAMHK